MSELILPLTAGDDSLESVGGKGRSLIQLIRYGLPVPDGFIVTAKAYRQYIKNAQLQTRILKLARPQIGAAGKASFDEASARIQDLFAQSPLSQELQQAVLQAYDGFMPHGAAVAVRSSANAEDLPDMSFAGQQDTFLNVSGATQLINAIHRCWASLWTARALNYRHHMGIDHDQVAMAVVVQRMANADVSGVLFTANPTTGARDEMIVNASFGLGEAIVSGEVTPDIWVLDRASLTPKDSVTGNKAHKVVAAGDGGVTLVKANTAERNAQSLDHTRLTELARLALKVEAAFDSVPQDIEWVFAQQQLWLVQSRPITSLPPAPLKDVHWDAPEPGAFLTRSQIVEHIPGPVSPLFEHLHMKQSLQYCWGLNNRDLHGADLQDTLPPTSFHVQTTVNGYAYRHLGSPPSPAPLPSRWTFNAAFAAIRASWKSATQWVPDAVRQHIKAPWGWFSTGFQSDVRVVLGWRFITLPRYQRTVRDWARLDLTDATDEQLWKGMRVLSQADARYWYQNGAWSAFHLSRTTEAELHTFVQQLSRERSIETPASRDALNAGQFLTGLKSRAFDAQVALWRIAGKIRAENALYEAVVAAPPQRVDQLLRSHEGARELVRELDNWLERYGKQIFTLDFAEPLLGEDRVKVMQNLKSLVSRADYDPVAQQQRMIEARDRLTDVTAQSIGDLKVRKAFLRLIRRARRFYPNREEAMFFMGTAWSVLRPMAHKLGTRLVSAGMLDEPGDIYFLTAAEVGRAVRVLANRRRAQRMAADPRFASLNIEQRLDINMSLPHLRTLAVERRQLREARRRLNPPEFIPSPPPYYWRPNDAQVRPAGPDTDAIRRSVKAFNGSPVSPGRITAPVSLVLTTDDFDRMKPGTILVCPATTPAWTQLFTQAVGLVTDIGGPLAHGSIVAREFGIPAVLGLGDMSQRLQDGQVITIDGTQGTVHIEGLAEDRDQSVPEPTAATDSAENTPSDLEENATLEERDVPQGWMLYRAYFMD